MTTWKVTVRFRDGEGPEECRGVDQETHVVDMNDLWDEAAVRAFVAANWAHMDFVSAVIIDPPPPVAKG